MKAFARFLLVLVVVTIACSAILLMPTEAAYPAPLGPKFDDHIRRNHLASITDLQPDIVMLGDSMLEVGVDGVRVAEELGRKIYDAALTGSASTLWYLILKNNIVDAPLPPKYLIIFFRDSLLTVPGFRVQGRYFEQIDEYATPKDRLLIERAYLNLMSPLEVWAERYFPPYSFRWQIRQPADELIRHLLPRKILGCSNQCADLAMMIVFGDDNVDPIFLSNAIDAADEYLYRSESLDFDRQVERSFLPEFIGLTRQHNIQLILVQMKTQKFSSCSPEFAGLLRYRADLEQYLGQQDVIYLDFSSDPRLKGEYFNDSLHFTQEGRDAFTGLLIEALGPYIQ